MKLTDRQVISLRKRIESAAVSKLAEKFKISETHVRNIINGRFRRDLLQPTVRMRKIAFSRA